MLSTSLSAQEHDLSRNVFFVTGGRIAFGTGDFFGYTVNSGYSRRLASAKGFLQHLCGQIELGFEYGNNQPKVINPTMDDFLGRFYYSTANIAIAPKLAYYPFKKTFLKGLNIAAGFPIGYTNQNREFQATLFYDSASQIRVRRSYLEYINQVILGYRVTVGYEYLARKHFLFGARADFENYTNLGDMNTMLALKIGYHF